MNGIEIMDNLKFEQSAISAAKGKNIEELLPAAVRLRLPIAEWLDNPNAWSKTQFFEETAEFMYEVYGVGCSQDRHLLGMLADQVETYVNCSHQINKDTLLVAQNDGKTIGANPWVSIREKTLIRIVALMNELGLTPKNRLASNKSPASTALTDFLKGPRF